MDSNLPESAFFLDNIIIITVYRKVISQVHFFALPLKSQAHITCLCRSKIFPI